MNREKIIQIYKARKARQEQFIKDHGIMCPIRAVDTEITKGCFYDNLADAVDWIVNETKNADAVLNKMVVDESMVNEPMKLLNEKYNALKTESFIIGYFAASCPEGSKEIKFGWTILDPLDADNNNKDVAILQAFNKLERFTLKHPGDPLTVYEDYFNKHSKKSYQIFDLRGQSKVFVRFWPMSLTEQFERFEDKCRRYYKQFSTNN